VVVQGRGDWISRLWFTRVDHRVACGHRDYLRSAEVLALCIDAVRRLDSGERERDRGVR
jgi:hypothetical protein